MIPDPRERKATASGLVAALARGDGEGFDTLLQDYVLDGGTLLGLVHELAVFACSALMALADEVGLEATELTRQVAEGRAAGLQT